MSARTGRDLDTRIRNAWPVRSWEIAVGPTDAERVRSLVAARVAAGTAPDGGTAAAGGRRAAPSRRPGWMPALPRFAAVVAGIVVLAGSLGLGGLIASRTLGGPDRITLDGNPSTDVRAASSATRAALDDASVRRTVSTWITRGELDLAAMRDHVAGTDPMIVETRVDAPDGDRLWDNNVLAPLTGFESRLVDGAYYLRAPGFTPGQGWVHLTDLGEPGNPEPLAGFSRVTPLPVADALTALAAHDGYRTAQSDGETIRYEAAGTTDDISALVVAILFDADSTVQWERAPATPFDDAQLSIWLDARTGLVNRIEAMTFISADGEFPQPTLRHFVLTLQHGDAATRVRAPSGARDLTVDELCAQTGVTCG